MDTLYCVDDSRLTSSMIPISVSVFFAVPSRRAPPLEYLGLPRVLSRRSRASSAAELDSGDVLIVQPLPFHVRL